MKISNTTLLIGAVLGGVAILALAAASDEETAPDEDVGDDDSTSDASAQFEGQPEPDDEPYDDGIGLVLGGTRN